MVYESSYESGRMPFLPDPTRGTWAAPTDFIFACLGLAFKLDNSLMGWFFISDAGVSLIFLYMICLFVYVVPIMVIQSFMGQFSSSGFISAFRISPFFKGMGYISLALNFLILIYYSTFAAVPLLYLLNSFRPTLPWSCESFESWSHNITESHICNINHTKVEVNETELVANSTESYDYVNYQVPSVLYFRTLFGGVNDLITDHESFILSWPLVATSFLVWAIVAGIFYKFFNTAKFGKLLRYGTCTTVAMLIICLIRFLFLPGAASALENYFTPSRHAILNGLVTVPMYSVAVFGAGWGSFVTLASFNNFKTNIMQYSWFIGAGQIAIFQIFDMVLNLVESHFLEITDSNYYSYVEHHWVTYLSTGSAIAPMKWANLWSILFYGMMSLSALIIIITQLFSFLTSVFDEFEGLRSHKRLVTFSLIGFMSLSSIYFCSSEGVTYFSTLSMDSLFTQTILNLMILLVVLWVYGRERFQRDIEFMLGLRFETWRINVLRFVAPICLAFAMFIGFLVAYFEHMFTGIVVQLLAILFFVLPWLLIPGYGIFIMLQTSGTLKMRFKRSCRPTDWYPVEMEHRQKYEEAMGNMDITHQLSEVGEEAL